MLKAFQNLIEASFVAIAFILMLASFEALAWEPVGSGTVIRELPDPWYVAPQVRDSYNSFEVSEDTVDHNGFATREETTFDCGPNWLGEQVCRERY